MIGLSYRNLLRNKGRTFLTILGIVIGVTAIVSLVSISDGITREAHSTLSNYQYIFLLEKGAMGSVLSHLPESIGSRVARVGGVKDYTFTVNGFASTFAGNRVDASSSVKGSKPILIVGIEPEKADEFKNTISWYDVKEGRMLRKGEDDSMLVSENILDDYNLYIGAWVEMNGKKYRIIGTIDVPSSIGSMTRMVVIDIDESRRINNYADDEVGLVNIIPSDLSESEKLIERLKVVFKDECSVFSSDDTTEMLGSFLDTLTIALWAVSSIAAIVGAVVVLNTMLMSVMERIQEFGVLKAIGWRDRDVVIMVVGEALLISLCGGIVGSIFGFIGSYLVYVFSGIPTYVPLSLVAEVIGFSSLIGIVSSLYPAFVAASMSPVEAVTYE